VADQGSVWLRRGERAMSGPLANGNFGVFRARWFATRRRAVLHQYAYPEESVKLFATFFARELRCGDGAESRGPAWKGIIRTVTSAMRSIALQLSFRRALTAGDRRGEDCAGDAGRERWAAGADPHQGRRAGGTAAVAGRAPTAGDDLSEREKTFPQRQRLGNAANRR